MSYFSDRLLVYVFQLRVWEYMHPQSKRNESYFKILLNLRNEAEPLKLRRPI